MTSSQKKSESDDKNRLNDEAAVIKFEGFKRDLQQPKFGFAVDTNLYVPDANNRDIGFELPWQIHLRSMRDAVDFFIPTVWHDEILRFTKSTVPRQLKYERPKLIHPEILDAVRSLDAVVDRLHAAAETVAIDLWTRHKEETGAISVPLDNSVLDQVMELYSVKKAPFNVQGDKKHEFPDAFALTALEKFAKERRNYRVVVATADQGCLDYCRHSEYLVGFSSASAALNVLESDTKQECERLLKFSEELSKAEANLRAIEKELKFWIPMIDQFRSYSQNHWHTNIPPSFQPKIKIVSVDSVRIVKENDSSFELNVVAASDLHFGVTGVAEVTVHASGYVNAFDPESGATGPLPLIANEPRAFKLKFSANFGKKLQKEQGDPVWQASPENSQKALISLPEPPEIWEPRPIA